jgi:hypothetical protein
MALARLAPVVLEFGQFRPRVMLDQVSLGLSYGHICPIRPIRSCRGRHVHANHRPRRLVPAHRHAPWCRWGCRPQVSGRRHAVHNDHGGHALHTCDLDCHRHHDGHDHGEIVASGRICAIFLSCHRRSATQSRYTLFS